MKIRNRIILGPGMVARDGRGGWSYTVVVNRDGEIIADLPHYPMAIEWCKRKFPEEQFEVVNLMGQRME